MIHEYALEPELVATWANRQDCRYFREKFGPGQPRIVSRYPKRWKRLVWDAFRSENDIEKKLMEELLARMSERMVRRRNCVWESESTWLGNAQREHERAPFRAILARANPTDHASTLIAEGLGDSTPLWAAPRGVTIARSASEMAAVVAAMLRIAEIVIFVDPYFRPGRVENRRPLGAFLRAVVDGRAVEGPPRVEVHTSLDREGAPEVDFFHNECLERLPGCIPGGMRLAILRLSQRSGGERLHNRYILTEVGGVVFSAGLDDGADGETDDVTLMDRAQYELRWSQHATNAMAFEVPEVRVEVRSRD